MTNYQLINNNVTTIVKLMNNGHISPSIIIQLEIYEVYFTLSGTKMEKYQRLAEKYGISTTTVRRIISKMNEKIK
ncbi:hypothetical protein IIF7_11293 [Zunongwangia atlantica 22II14-10F7]|uniref:Uncharacterized protein n=1 Tax=Zunongwangia atlantica 22II14-10F7 TaxID=1185767 RepID=A0A1Y1T4M9_9FLAO|nr:hypothetical protein IIF7_11293 [Zunongwangia atlantica 22II14-10F7]